MAEPCPDSAAVKLPPPLTFAVPLLAGLAVDRWLPLIALPALPSRVAGAILVAAGLAFTGWARVLFIRRGTTVLPFRPSSVFVADGPFRFSRNPIYVGFIVAYAGIALLCRAVWPLIFLPFVVVAIRRTAIAKEEAYLERRFGAQYLEYKVRVRRWL
jgi:protein-S-isoprenylcysteine O-methyltransferase Ste14